MADNPSLGLRNTGDEVIEYVSKGERLPGPGNGEPVAELRALAGKPKSLEAVLRNRRHLPTVDPSNV